MSIPNTIVETATEWKKTTIGAAVLLLMGGAGTGAIPVVDAHFDERYLQQTSFQEYRVQAEVRDIERELRALDRQIHDLDVRYKHEQDPLMKARLDERLRLRHEQRAWLKSELDKVSRETHSG